MTTVEIAAAIKEAASQSSIVCRIKRALGPITVLRSPAFGPISPDAALPTARWTALSKSGIDTLELVRESTPQYAPSPEAEELLVDRQVVQPGVIQAPSQAKPAAGTSSTVVGPGLNLVPTPTRYAIHLSGAVVTQSHVEQVVRMLIALKASLPAAIKDGALSGDSRALVRAFSCYGTGMRDLEEQLRKAILGARAGDRVVTIHLFGIDHAAELVGVNLYDLAERARLGKSFGTELRKGVRLAEHVKRR